MSNLTFWHYLIFVIFIFIAVYFCIGRFGQWHQLYKTYQGYQTKQPKAGNSFSLTAFRLGYISYKSSVNMAVDGDCLRIFMQPGFGLGHPQISAIPLADIQGTTRQTAIGTLVALSFAKAPGVTALISPDIASTIAQQSNGSWQIKSA